MRAENEDQLRPVAPRKRFPWAHSVVALAILAGILLFWFREDPAPLSDAPPAPPALPQTRPGPQMAPDIPRRGAAPAEPEMPAVAAMDPVGEPTDNATAQPRDDVPVAEAQYASEQGDQLVRERLVAGDMDGRLQALAANEHPLDATAALIDAAGRGMIMRKILRGIPALEPFEARRDGEAMFMSEASYQRYDAIAQSIARLDVEYWVDTFHVLRPYYEKTFGNLGLDADSFDNSVISALDLILGTPEIEEPIELHRTSVVYLYSDPDLEGLPDLQKQLLRMGPDNIRRIKQQAQQLRDTLLTPN